MAVDYLKRVQFLKEFEATATASAGCFTIVGRRAFLQRLLTETCLGYSNPKFPRNLNNSHNQAACRALNLDCTKTGLTSTEAVGSSQLLLKSTFSMGSAGHSVKLRNPWIETPLIESRALSKAAGWYAGDLHSTLASLTLLTSQQRIPQTREPAAVWLL
jgi:hypothetical protein